MCGGKSRRFKLVTTLMVFAMVVLVVTLIVTLGVDRTRFRITIGHINDFKSHFSGIMPECAENCQCISDNRCIGGISRLWSVYQEMKDATNFIFLNAGNNFMGTNLFYFFGWNITQYFLKQFLFDAYTIGISEVISKEDYIAEFINVVRYRSPVVVCNMGAPPNSRLDGLFNKSIVIEKGRMKIGVIGAISSKFVENELTDQDNFTFAHAEQCINEEAERLVKEDNVFTIILLSHCGFSKDTTLAQTVGPKISVIVGGQSRTLLYTGIPPERDVFADGPYPTVIKHKSGSNVLVVSTEGLSKYFGNLTVILNSKGEPIEWSGDPIYVDESFRKDNKFEEDLNLWNKEMETKVQVVIGETKVPLSTERCTLSECTMGNLVADSLAYAWTKTNKHAMAVLTSHSLVYELDVGNITFDDAMKINPYENTVDIGKLKGRHIRETFEYATFPHEEYQFNFLQISGIKITYNLSRPMGDRVVHIQIKCQTCEEEKYEDLQDQQFYYIVTTSYVIHGGGGVTSISRFIKNVAKGRDDVDVLVDYIKKHTPITTTLEGRIKVLD